MLLWILLVVLVICAIAFTVAAILQRPIDVGPDPLESGAVEPAEDFIAPTFAEYYVRFTDDGHEELVELHDHCRPGDMSIAQGREVYVLRRTHPIGS